MRGIFHSVIVEPLEGRAYLSVSLSPPILSPAGKAPQGLAVADFNGDGKMDVAVTDFKTGTVSVLFGKGDGTFQKPKSYSVGPNLSGITAADLNGDGKPDLAVIGDSLFTLINNGNGTFGKAKSIAVGNTPKNVAAADLNGDGKVDLVVANVFSNDVSVLIGNGDGTFAPAVSVPAITGAAAVTIADFNGDGKPDLAVAGLGDLSGTGNEAGVAILLGQGDGTFGSPTVLTAGTAPISVQAGDLNGDGKLDLAVANGGLGTNAPGSNNVSVLLGAGDGTFSAAQTYPTGSIPEGIAIGDVDGDHKLDLITADDGSASISVLVGNGDGTFQPAVDFPGGAGNANVAVADFNGDGLPDIVSGDSLSTTVSVQLNTQGQTSGVIP